MLVTENAGAQASPRAAGLPRWSLPYCLQGPPLRLNAEGCTASSNADSWLKEAFGDAGKYQMKLENLPLPLSTGISETQVRTASWLPFSPAAAPLQGQELQRTGKGQEPREVMKAAAASRQAGGEQVRAVTANLQALGQCVASDLLPAAAAGDSSFPARRLMPRCLHACCRGWPLTYGHLFFLLAAVVIFQQFSAHVLGKMY